MDANLDFLPQQEQLPLRLRLLYEKFGYSRYRMGKFESYDIYMENRSFLKSEGIITFTNAQGNLMALKPDVTLSIVKNALPDSGTQKLFYNENVFRIEHRGEEYREISQMGIEYLGNVEEYEYAQAEVISLALDSLSMIEEEYALDISHMGFISGLMNALNLSDSDRETVLSELRKKNADGLSSLCFSLGITGTAEKAIVEASRLRMPLRDGISAAKKLVLCKEMSDALAELEALEQILAPLGKTAKVFLDFSLINDMDYYNGIVFRGYVRSSKRAVLSGGRYDNLMRRFGKPHAAVGFALYLSELDRVLHHRPEFDVDTLLIYGNASPEQTALAVQKLLASGSVRAEKNQPSDVRARKTVFLTEGGNIHA